MAEEIPRSGIQLLGVENYPAALQEMADQKKENDMNPFADDEPQLA